MTNLSIRIRDGIWSTCLVDRASVARVEEVVARIMENAVRLSVPLKVELS